MYISIPINEGLQTIKSFVISNVENGEGLMHLLAWVLKNNYFQFGSQWYQQIKGAAIGGNVSGTFADLVVGVNEAQIKAEHPELWPTLYHRYRDDSIAKGNPNLLDQFYTKLHEKTKLDWNLEQLGKRVNFLDLTIYHYGPKFNTHGIISYKPYSKPMMSPYVPEYTTYKPNSTKLSWITGENIRLLRNSKHPKQFEAQQRKLKRKLMRSGYPKAAIRSKMCYPYRHRHWLMHKKVKTHTRFLKQYPSQNAHNRWNYLQHRCDPLLRYLGLRLTSVAGRTIRDTANSIAKRQASRPPRLK